MSTEVPVVSNYILPSYTHLPIKDRSFPYYQTQLSRPSTSTFSPFKSISYLPIPYQHIAIDVAHLTLTPSKFSMSGTICQITEQTPSISLHHSLVTHISRNSVNDEHSEEAAPRQEEEMAVVVVEGKEMLADKRRRLPGT
jgi:hypothetical protein